MLNRIFSTITFFLFMFIFPIKTYSASETEIGRKAVESFGKKIKKEQGWILSGSGGSFYNPENIVLNLTFSVCGNFNLEKSRVLIIETAEKFIKHINRESKYINIFKNHKFDETNINLSIDFFDCDSDQIKDDHVAYVCLRKSKISYYYEPDPQKLYVRHEEEIETYEQAKAIVVAEQSKLQD